MGQSSAPDLSLTVLQMAQRPTYMLGTALGELAHYFSRISGPIKRGGVKRLFTASEKSHLIMVMANFG